MTEPLIKLKPCPFCGNTVRLELFETLLLPYYVICDKCGALGPNDLSNSGACEAWNTHPIEAQLLEACKMLVSAYGIYQTEPAYAIGMKAIAAAEGEK